MLGRPGLEFPLSVLKLVGDSYLAFCLKGPEQADPGSSAIKAAPMVERKVLLEPRGVFPVIRHEFESLAVHVKIRHLISPEMALIKGAAVKVYFVVPKRCQRVPNQQLDTLVKCISAPLLLATQQEEAAPELPCLGQLQDGLSGESGHEVGVNLLFIRSNGGRDGPEQPVPPQDRIDELPPEGKVRIIGFGQGRRRVLGKTRRRNQKNQ